MLSVSRDTRPTENKYFIKLLIFKPSSIIIAEFPKTPKVNVKNLMFYLLIGVCAIYDSNLFLDRIRKKN